MAKLVSAKEFYGAPDYPLEETPKPRVVSAKEFFSGKDYSEDFIPKPPPEPEEFSRTGELGKGLVRGSMQYAQSLLGTLPEVAGQAYASAVDSARRDNFTGVNNDGTVQTPEQIQAQREAVAQSPTQNPLAGHAERMRPYTGAFPESLAVVAPNEAVSQELAPYFEWGGPGDMVPVPKFGRTQQARFAGEVGEMIPQTAPTIGAAVASGGLGAAPAAMAFLSGGGLEALSEYDQSIAAGDDPDEALRKATIMFGGTGALNAIPFSGAAMKFLPPRLRNRVIQGAATAVLEGATEMSEGGVSAIGKIEKTPGSYEEWKDAFTDIAQGVWDERSVFLAAALLGGGTGLASPSEATLERAKVAAVKALNEMKAAEEAQEVAQEAPQQPVSSPEESEYYEEDFAPFDVPQAPQEPVAPVAAPAPVPEPVAAPTPAPAPVPAPAPQQAEQAPTLPRELRGAKPRYRNRQPFFESDLDKALYIIAQDKKSKRDQDYLDFVMQNTGMSEAQARAAGIRLKRGHIKRIYDSISENDAFRVPPSDVLRPAGERSSVPQEQLDILADTGLLDEFPELAQETPTTPVQAPAPTPTPAPPAPEAPVAPETRPQGDVETQTAPEPTQTAPAAPEAAEAPVARADMPEVSPEEAAEIRRWLVPNINALDELLTEAIQKGDTAEAAKLRSEIESNFKALEEADAVIKGTELDDSQGYWRKDLLGEKPPEVAETPTATTSVVNESLTTQEAEFVGWQERGRGKPPLALYNIPVEGGGRSTVSAETARAQGFTVPEPTEPAPAPTPRAQLEQRRDEVKAKRAEPEGVLSPDTQDIVDVYGGDRKKTLMVLRGQKARAQKNSEPVSPAVTAAIEELTLGGKSEATPTKATQTDLFGQSDTEVAPGMQTELIAEDVAPEFTTIPGSDALADWRKRVRRIGVKPPGGSITWEDLGFHETRPPVAPAKAKRKQEPLDWDQWLADAYEKGLISEAERSEPSTLARLLRGRNETRIQVSPEGVDVPGARNLAEATTQGGGVESIADVMKRAGLVRESAPAPATKKEQLKQRAAEKKARSWGEIPSVVKDSIVGQKWYENERFLAEQKLLPYTSPDDIKNPSAGIYEKAKAQAESQGWDWAAIEEEVRIERGIDPSWMDEGQQRVAAAGKATRDKRAKAQSEADAVTADVLADRKKKDEEAAQKKADAKEALLKKKVEKDARDEAQKQAEIDELSATIPTAAAAAYRAAKSKKERAGIVNDIYGQLPEKKRVPEDWIVDALERKPVPPATPINDAIISAALDITGGSYENRVRLADLREALPNIPRKQLDDTLKQMQTDGDLVLYRNDDPQDMTPRDRGAQLLLGSDPRDLLYLKRGIKPGAAEKVEGKRGADPEKAAAGDSGLNVIRYNATTDAISNPETGDIYATVRTVKKRGGGTRYEVKGYSKIAGKHPDLEGDYDARTKDDAIAAAREIAQRETGEQPAPAATRGPRASVPIGSKMHKEIAALLPPDVARYNEFEGRLEFDPSFEGTARLQEGIEKAINESGLPKKRKNALLLASDKLMTKVFQTAEKVEGKRKADPNNPEAGYANIGAIFGIPKAIAKKIKASPYIDLPQGYGAAKKYVLKRRGKLKSYGMRGKLIYQDFENGYRKIVKEQGLKGKLTNRIVEIPKDISETLNSYLIEEDPDLKADYLAELHPYLQKPATEMRYLVDEMTRTMIAMGIPTEEQAQVMADNMGVYLRRSFDIFNDPDFRDIRGGEESDIWKRTHAYLMEVYKDKGYTKEQVDGIMTDLNSVYEDKTALNRLVSRGGILGKIDRSTLGHREEIPEAIQEFWGVSRDGVRNFLNTIEAQAHILQNFEMLSDFVENGDGVFVARASTVRDIEKGRYTGKNGKEIMSWPRMNDAETRRAQREYSRERATDQREEALASAMERAQKMPDGPRKDAIIAGIREHQKLLRSGLKKNKAGVINVDPENLGAVPAYLDHLTANVDQLSKALKADKKNTELRKRYNQARHNLEKYTKQFNKYVGEAQASEDVLPDIYTAFGPMAGGRIHPDLKAALEEAVMSHNDHPIISGWQWLNAQAKKNVTTREPASALRNLRSSLDFATASGWFYYNVKQMPSRFGKALAIANVDIRRSHDPENRELYLRATELLVAGDTAIIGDITETQREAHIPTKWLRSLARENPEVVKALGGADALATKLYQAGDDVYKIFGWLTETEQLMNANPDWTVQQAEEEAARIVRRQYPTYTEVPNWVRALKRFPVAGPFISFQSEVYRTSWNTLAQATIEIRSDNQATRRMGYRRMAGILQAMGNRSAYAMIAAAIFGITPDDDDKIREGIMDYYRDDSFIWYDADREKGLYTGINSSHIDAYHALKEPLYAAMRGDDPVEAGVNAFEAATKPYWSPEIGTGMMAEMLANMMGKSDSIFLESDPFYEKSTKLLATGAGAFLLPRSVTRHLRATTPEKQMDEFLNTLTGSKPYHIDLPKQLFYIAGDYKEVAREQARDVYRELRANDTGGARSQIEEANAVRKERFERLHKAYTEFRASGVLKSLLDQSLKDAGLSEKERNAVQYNNYIPWEGSEAMREALLNTP